MLTFLAPSSPSYGQGRRLIVFPLRPSLQFHHLVQLVSYFPLFSGVGLGHKSKRHGEVFVVLCFRCSKYTVIYSTHDNHGHLACVECSQNDIPFEYMLRMAWMVHLKAGWTELD